MFVDGNYYLKYAIGIYGWPIHVFMNPCTCICKLCCSERYVDVIAFATVNIVSSGALVKIWCSDVPFRILLYSST